MVPEVFNPALEYEEKRLEGLKPEIGSLARKLLPDTMDQWIIWEVAPCI
jgi:hypothetical protein